jgi:hypothetical protein
MVFGKERAEHADQRFVRIADHDSGLRPHRTRSQLLGDEHGAGTRVSEIMQIAAGHGQRQGIGAGAVEGAHSRNTHITIAKQAATDEVGDRLRGEAGSRHATSCLL